MAYNTANLFQSSHLKHLQYPLCSMIAVFIVMIWSVEARSLNNIRASVKSSYLKCESEQVDLFHTHYNDIHKVRDKLRDSSKSDNSDRRILDSCVNRLMTLSCLMKLNQAAD